ncbi:MAG: fibronectin type III domain-containing protein, partial [Bacteroidia bacterium]
MKKVTLIFTLIASFCFTIKAQNLIHSEILGRPTDHTMTVQVFFDTVVDASIQYGTASGVYPNQTNWQTFAIDEPTEIEIKNLTEDTKYFYRLAYRKPNTTNIIYRPEYTFQTSRKLGTSFSFTIQADPHVDEQTDTALYRLCLKNQLEDKPDFMIDLGDFLMSDKLTNA